MKNIFFILILNILFLVKTENLLSQTSVFIVSNIQIKAETHLSKDKILDKAINEGFKKFLKRILLEKDQRKLQDVSVESKKNLVSHFQIKKEEDDKHFVNLYFDKEKVNNFFYDRGVSYSNFLKTEIVIFPIYIKNNNFFIYSDNYFYNNWISSEDESASEQLEYLFPIENLEMIQLIKNNFENLQNLSLNSVFESEQLKNRTIIIIDDLEYNVNVFLKGVFNNKNISKNFTIKKDINDKDQEEKIKLIIKRNITEIIKSTNLIDVQLPKFLNLEMKSNKKNNLTDINEILISIDSIENIQITELSNKSTTLRIKYFGELQKIFEILYLKGIKTFQKNEIWMIEKI